ncbi:MAG: reductive dehalogenase domain-containing protein [Prochlorococcaceae cyanobacterium]
MSIRKFLPPKSFQRLLSDYGELLLITLRNKSFTALVAIITHTLFPLLRWLQQQKINNRETIWLDDMPGPPQSQTFPHLAFQAADLTANSGPKRKRAPRMKVDYPSPDYPFAYRHPPLSGNVINGLGEDVRRQPDHVFFGDSYKRAWGKLDWYFQVMEPTSIHRQIAQIFWQDSGRVGVVARRNTAPADPSGATALIKKAAVGFGAKLVGITRMGPQFCYQDSSPDFHYAISVAWPMKREEMLHTPSQRSNREIMDSYRQVNLVAIKLAKYIRSLGHPAQASTNLAPGSSTEVLHIPIAIEAGLGQLGKHGSLITAEFGSNVRLATVLTDLPLAIDKPRDLGVDDLCSNCRICETNCPPHAISSEKQVVRGQKRWYVNFDKCAPYFAETRGCGICIEVCPWSEPGKGIELTKMLLSRRNSAAERG